MSKKTSGGIIVAIIILALIAAFIPLSASAETDTVNTGTTVDVFTTYSTKLTASVSNKINTKIKWKKINGAKKYVVYRATKGSKYKKVDTTTKLSKTFKRTFKHTYYYKVRAYKILNGEKIYSKYSVAKKVKSRVNRSFSVKAYAYHESGVCANGQRCAVGRIATDPRVIKTGSWLWVNGYGLCKACDTGGDIVGRTVDLYMSSESACDSWGVRYPKVYILK